MNVEKFRKKVLERGSIQEIINFMQALPFMEMKGETGRVLYKLEKYVNLFGQDLQKWNEAGFNNPNEIISITKQANKRKTKNQQETLFALRRFDDIYFKHSSQEEIEKLRNQFLSDACYKLALELPNANVELLENKMLNLGIEKDVINFAKDVKGASKDMLAKYYNQKRNTKAKETSKKTSRKKSFEETVESVL